MPSIRIEERRQTKDPLYKFNGSLLAIKSLILYTVDIFIYK